MLDTGQNVDRYTVDSIIGYGGTAVVYLVKHVQLSTVHALKVLSVSSGAIRERMLREGRVQAALTHPNVVAVSDVLDVDGAPGLLMEYIEGPSLEEALKNFRISLENGVTLFRGIVLGVHAAHETGLVHRDLKPANVLLAESDEGFVPKVTDFGLAKVLVGEGIDVGTTRAGIAMGTPSYMSPEQIRDARKVDQRADVFSLGCLLYELVTGQRAFPGDQALTIYNAITAGEYLPAEQLVADLPETVIQCVDGCLALDLDERIPDCATVLEVLAGIQEWHVSPHPIPTEAIVERMHDDVPLMQVAGPFSEDDLTASEQPIMDGSIGADAEFDPVPPKRRGLAFAAGMLGLGIFLLLLLGFGVARFAQTVFAPVPKAVQATTSLDSLPGPTAVSEKKDAPQEEPTEDEEPVTSTDDGAVGDELSGTDVTAADAEEPVAVTEVKLAPALKPKLPKRTRKVSKGPQKVKLLSVPPNAALLLDGKEQGRTNKKLDLEVGSYSVTLRSGDKDRTFKIGVKEGAGNKWCYDFTSDKVWNKSCPLPE